MKVTGAGRVSTSGVDQGGRRAPPAGGFSVSGAEEAHAAAQTAPAGGASALSSIDALITLQQVEEPLGRRRRAIGRAGRLLDALDELKLAVLEGSDDPAALARLGAAVREERLGAEGDQGLQAVLDQIETRAAVELAKRDMRSA